MFKMQMPRFLTTFLCVTFAFLSTFAKGQAQPQPGQADAGQPARSPADQAAIDDQTAMREAMQPVFQTIMQNMMAKGIDPGQFFGQMQEGADPADIQKQLISQGLIDKNTLDQMTSKIQKIQGNSIKRQLKATDEQWKVLWPLVQRVIKASAAANGSRGPMGPMAGMLSGVPATRSEMSKAMAAIKSALKDPGTDSAQFTGLLKDYRTAHAQALAELAAAQQELISALDTRQEAILSQMGIIE